MRLTAHSKLLLPQDSGARTCLPGPASCLSPAGHVCDGAMSVLLYQLDDTTSPSLSSFVCSSFIVLYFCAIVSK